MQNCKFSCKKKCTVFLSAAEGAVVFLTVDWNGAGDGRQSEFANTPNTLVNYGGLKVPKLNK